MLARTSGSQRARFWPRWGEPAPVRRAATPARTPRGRNPLVREPEGAEVEANVSGGSSSATIFFPEPEIALQPLQFGAHVDACW